MQRVFLLGEAPPIVPVAGRWSRHALGMHNPGPPRQPLIAIANRTEYQDDHCH
ncbi:hypothetical protein ACSZNS_12890 [Aeromonas caviae]